MKQSDDLHGNAPDHSEIVLVLIDVINDFEFPGGEALFQNALPAADQIAALKRRAQQAGVPVIYANDNFGRWRSDFQKIVNHCVDDDVRGKPIAQLLKPDDDDYFVLKPKHSGFFSTTLDLLLQYLGAQRLILTGFATNNCVLFTANDAYLRDYKLIIPADCTASIRGDETDSALKQMQQVLKADIRASTEIDFERDADTTDSHSVASN
jgi:nicotinamidase-related amidase